MRWLRGTLLLLPLVIGVIAMVSVYAIEEAFEPNCIVNFRDPIEGYCNAAAQAEEDVMNTAFILFWLSVPIAAVAWVRAAIRFAQKRQSLTR